MPNSPKYLLDSLHGENFFKVHSQIAHTLFEIIKSEDLSKNSFTLALLGSWGSGKSKVVSLLKDELKDESDIFFIEFDVWKYIDSSLYRSILFDLEKELIKKAEDKTISAEFKKGYKSNNGESLYDILYSDTELTIPQNPVPENTISKWISICEKNIWGNIFSKLILRPFNLILKVFSYLFKRVEIVVLIIVVFAGLIWGYIGRENIYSWFPVTNTDTFKFVFKLFFASVVGIAALEFMKEFFKDFFKELLPKEIKNVIITSPPTFAQDQFESIFKDIISKLHKDGSHKIVLVFDNIDRCETDITLKVLTGLKTFLDAPNCFYLIPCDDIRIKEHFQTTAKADDDYLDKIFQAYLRIPILTEENKILFIEKCITESEFKLEPYEQIKISQILTLAYKGNTPRQIKRFFNDFISYYKLAINIDPQKTFLLKDIGHFTFMATIKQKWPNVEEILIKSPTAFKNFKSGQNDLNFPSDFFAFLEQCISWIDLESNPADFVYLTDAKQAGSNVQRIILENSDDYILNKALVNDFNALFDSFVNTRRYLFLETGIERLKNITEKYLNTKDTFLGIELFKIYVKNILRYDGLDFDNKKNSFVLTHHLFISENAEYFSRFYRNQVNEIEIQLLNKLKETGCNEDTTLLFVTFVKYFKHSNVSNMFRNIPESNLEKLSPFILTIDADTGIKITPVEFINKIATAITLKKDENYFLSVFKHLSAKAEILNAKKIISGRVTQELITLESIRTTDPIDKFILDALEILNNDDWEANDKIIFDKQILTRITILFKTGHIATAIGYSVYTLLLKVNNLTNLFESSSPNNLYVADNFEKLLTSIIPSQMEIILQDDTSRDVLLKTSSSHNKFTLLFEKLQTSYLVEHLDKICFDSIQCVISLLELVSSRQDEDTETRKNLEKNIFELYYNKNRNLILDNFDSIFPKMSSRENKFFYAVVTINHLSQDINKGIADILNILNKIDFDNISELYDKIYMDNKINFVNIDNVDLFSKIISNVSSSNQSDYLDRLLNKILPNLKGGSTPSDILKSFTESLPINLFNGSEDLFDKIILELLELSRKDEDNIIGLKLLSKIHDKGTKLKGKFSKRIEAIYENVEKTAETKDFIETHFKSDIN